MSTFPGSLIKPSQRLQAGPLQAGTLTPTPVATARGRLRVSVGGQVQAVGSLRQRPQAIPKAPSARLDDQSLHRSEGLDSWPGVRSPPHPSQDQGLADDAGCSHHRINDRTARRIALGSPESGNKQDQSRQPEGTWYPVSCAEKDYSSEQEVNRGKHSRQRQDLNGKHARPELRPQKHWNGNRRSQGDGAGADGRGDEWLVAHRQPNRCGALSRTILSRPRCQPQSPRRGQRLRLHTGRRPHWCQTGTRGLCRYGALPRLGSSTVLPTWLGSANRESDLARPGLVAAQARPTQLRRRTSRCLAAGNRPSASISGTASPPRTMVSPRVGANARATLKRHPCCPFACWTWA